MTTVAPGLIALLTVIVGAFVTFILNRRMQIEAAWRSEKLTYYKSFMDSFAMIVEDNKSVEHDRQFARASNNLLLIASPDVLKAHHAFRAHIRISNQPRDYDKDSDLLAELLNAIRADLRMPADAPIEAQDVKLWAGAPPKPSP